MSNEKEKAGCYITSDTAKGRNFIALAAALGGEGMVEGINRIMDGLCPDCGTDEHDYRIRCFKKPEAE